MNDEKERLRKVIDRLTAFLPTARRYSLVAFLALVAIIYLTLFIRIHGLITAEPSDDQITSQVKAARVLHIDQEVVKQIQTLQDNSVNVQALFNQARNNPFQ